MTELDELDALTPDLAVPGDEKIVAAPEEVVEEVVIEDDFDDAPEPVEEPEPVTAPVVADAPEVPAEGSLEARLAAQQVLIDRLLAGQPIVDVPEGYVPPAPAAPAAPVVLAPAAPLVTEEQYDELMSDPKKFNEHLAALLKKTHDDAVAAAYGLALQNIPSVMEPSIHEAARNQYEVNSWIAANPIITQHQQAASTILNQVDAFHPHLPLKEKLAMALNTLSAHLGGAPQRTAATTRPTSGVQRPAFATAPRGALPKASARTGLQAELDDLTL